MASHVKSGLRWATALLLCLAACGAPSSPSPDDAFEAQEGRLTQTSAARMIPAFTMTMASSHSSLVGDGSTSSTVTATLKLANGTPLSGQLLTFTGSPNLIISPTTASTNCAGQATTTVASEKTGTRTIYAGPGLIRKLGATNVSFTCPGTFLATAGGVTTPYRPSSINGTKNRVKGDASRHRRVSGATRGVLRQ